MSTFTAVVQDKHRAAFIDECRQKAWGAACNADYIAKQLDGVMAEYQKRDEENRKLAEEANALEAAPDHHTVDNRNKRKAIQSRRDALNRAMQAIGKNVQDANRAISELHRSVESNLALAKHAEGWEWKEVETFDLSEKVDNHVEEVEVGEVTHGNYPTLEKLSKSD